MVSIATNMGAHMPGKTIPANVNGILYQIQCSLFTIYNTYGRPFGNSEYFDTPTEKRLDPDTIQAVISAIEDILPLPDD
jgi:hypothetical protein